MRPMSFPEKPRARRTLTGAVVLSLVIHGLALIVPQHQAASSGNRLPRLEASLARPQRPAEMLLKPAALPVPALAKKPAKASPRPLLMTVDKAGGAAVPSSPKWTVAEKAEMNGFLDELASVARARPQPTLAQRSLALARELARQQAQQEAAEQATLEYRPNATPPNPFSLELYLEALLKHLNRSSVYVKNDPKSKGVRNAAVQFRLNPDGSLKSFVVLNAADQGDEIAFIKSVVERAAPFSPFPPDINQAARSMAVRICITPSSGGGFGFSRASEGRGC